MHRILGFEFGLGFGFGDDIWIFLLALIVVVRLSCVGFFNPLWYGQGILLKGLITG